MRKPLIFIFLCLLLEIQAQKTFPVNGAHNPEHTMYAFIHCLLHVDSETEIKDASILVQDGRILEAGAGIKIPSEAIVYDLSNKHVYPSFIELFCDYGMPEIKPEHASFNDTPQNESNVKGAYGWNQAVRSSFEAYRNFIYKDDKAEELRKLGFALALTSSKDGIFRGSGCVVSLHNAKENELIVKDRAATFLSFDKGSSKQEYPSSLMGSIALIRQTLYDAQWYALQNPLNEFNINLEAIAKDKTLPVIFEVDNKFSALRADKIADEFKMPFIIKGSGDEYQRMNEIKNTFAKFILPLNFPLAFDVENPFDAENVSMAELKHWELAATNPMRFEKQFIPFAFTTSGLKEKSDFFKNIRKSIQAGLSEKAALKALTTIPAEMLGLQSEVGAVKKGYRANFIICSGEVFNENSIIYENWINGIPYRYVELNMPNLTGEHILNVGDEVYKVKVSGQPEKWEGKIFLKDTLGKSFNIKHQAGTYTLWFGSDSSNFIRIHAVYNGSNALKGEALNSGGNWVKAELKLNNNVNIASPVIPNKKTPEGEVIYPFSAYGQPEKDENIITRFKNRLGAILIKDATVWTNEADGVLKEHDVYIVEGKVVRIAPNIDAPKEAFAKIIDAKGKHLTPGIIDEHSHIAIDRGVNEGTKASSAEVRIGDVIDPDDINIYRQLAGGVVAAQLLHGSANPIGGQSALIKLRWGQNAEDMKIERADGFIKFALGENVKQSNWGDKNTTRFPQTRMGVEQVYYDHFHRARQYDLEMKQPQDSKSKVKSIPRRDLELEALSEILNKKRFITCHSYVQSEINMLMHVADSMGFKVNTFTHILEGYKVADKMKQHGVAASTFADWWAYKMEVMDAIPYNAAILNKMGVITAINSDDAEMGRRLNQEAAKAIKYGGVSEEDALKMVTLNPAKMLHLDKTMGSIKPGMSADLVLWTDHPLSINAKADKTIIDGIIYFDLENDVKLKEYNQKERNRIIQKMIQAKSKGEKTRTTGPKRHQIYHCETMEDFTYDDEQ